MLLPTLLPLEVAIVAIEVGHLRDLPLERTQDIVRLGFALKLCRPVLGVDRAVDGVAIALTLLHSGVELVTGVTANAPEFDAAP